MNELIELVNKLRREHYVCLEDCWFSCPLATYNDGERAYCGESAGCNCGADEHNKIVDEVIKRLTGDDSILFTCPDCQRVTVDMADVVVLEANNARLKKELDDLKFLLDTNIRLGIKADEFIVEQAAEIKQLEAQLSTKLTNIVDGNRELIEALRAVKAER